jgi:Rieske Fe-S protein
MGVSGETRRAALARLVTAGTGAIAAGFLALVGLVAAPRTPAPARRWRRAASVSDVPATGPLAVVLADRHADGWYETRRQTVVYLDRDGDGFRAVSASCTHLGCRVTWDDAKGQYLCPCHGGAYDREGRVVAGPPPAPLARVNVRVNEATSSIEVEL